MGASEIAQSPKFQHLMRAKRRFLIPLVMFFLTFYFTLPVLTSYTHVLDRFAFGEMTWAWLFALAQFPMTWAVCAIYIRRARKFDEVVAALRKAAEEQ